MMRRSIRLAACVLITASGTARADGPPSPSFSLVGHIESLTLDTPADPLSGGVLRLRGIDVLLPRRLQVTMPGKYLPVRKLFVGASTGLALRDQPRPAVAFEAEVIGNIVPTGGGERYVAVNVRISQGALHAGAGFIQSIDRAAGELRVGPRGRTDGARVRVNDPEGRYGLANAARSPAIAMDDRFGTDPDNAAVHASTGFPMCVPTPAPSAACGDNRPASNRLRFTCAGIPKVDDPASPDAPAEACDPAASVPLAEGDYVTYAGMLQPDGTDFIVAAHGITAEAGIYTRPGKDPAWLFTEVALQGTTGAPFDAIPQEATTRLRVVGFTTDPSRAVEVAAVDDDALNTPLSHVFSGLGGLQVPNGPVFGRFRQTWPSKLPALAVRRDLRVRIIGAAATVGKNQLRSGYYIGPIGEYIYPEPTTLGVPGYPLPVPVENFCFKSILSPIPASGHPAPQLIAGGSQRVCDP